MVFLFCCLFVVVVYVELFIVTGSIMYDVCTCGKKATLGFVLVHFRIRQKVVQIRIRHMRIRRVVHFRIRLSGTL